MPPTTAADIRKEWAAAIATKREADRRTQADVAAAAGVDQKTISNVERGIGSLDAFASIANELGVALLGES